MIDAFAVVSACMDACFAPRTLEARRSSFRSRPPRGRPGRRRHRPDGRASTPAGCGRPRCSTSRGSRSSTTLAARATARVFVGAGMTFARIAARARPSSAPLAEAARPVGSPQIRNRGDDRRQPRHRLAGRRRHRPCSPPTTPTSSSRAPAAARRVPLARVPGRPEADGARAGRADRRRRVAGRSTAPARSPRSARGTRW